MYFADCVIAIGKNVMQLTLDHSHQSDANTTSRQTWIRENGAAHQTAFFRCKKDLSEEVHVETAQYVCFPCGRQLTGLHALQVLSEVK